MLDQSIAQRTQSEMGLRYVMDKPCFSNLTKKRLSATDAKVSEITVKPMVHPTLDPEGVLRNPATFVITNSDAFYVYTELTKKDPGLPIAYINHPKQMHDLYLDKGQPHFPVYDILEKGGVLVLDLQAITPKSRLSLNGLTENPPTFRMECPKSPEHPNGFKTLTGFHPETRIVWVDSTEKLATYESDFTGRTFMYRVAEEEAYKSTLPFDTTLAENFPEDAPMITVDMSSPYWKKTLIGDFYANNGEIEYRSGHLEQALKEGKKIVLLNIQPHNKDADKFLKEMALTKQVRLPNGRILDLSSLTIERCEGYPETALNREEDLRIFCTYSDINSIPNAFPITAANAWLLYPSVGSKDGKLHGHPGLLDAKPTLFIAETISANLWRDILDSQAKIYCKTGIKIPSEMNAYIKLDNLEEGVPEPVGKSQKAPVPENAITFYLSEETTFRSLLQKSTVNQRDVNDEVQPVLEALREGKDVVLKNVSAELERSLISLLTNTPQIFINGEIEAIKGRLFIERKIIHAQQKTPEDAPAWAKAFITKIPDIVKKYKRDAPFLNDIATEIHQKFIAALAEKQGYAVAILSGMLEIFKPDQALYYFLLSSLKCATEEDSEQNKLQAYIDQHLRTPKADQSFWQQVSQLDVAILRRYLIDDTMHLPFDKRQDLIKECENNQHHHPINEKTIDQICTDIHDQLPICKVFTMIGETGVGKSRACLRLDKTPNTKVYRIKMNAQMTQEKLRNHPTFKAFMKDDDDGKRHILIFDEFNLAPPGVYTFLDEFLDGGSEVTLAEKPIRIPNNHYFGKVGNPPETYKGRFVHPIQGTLPILFEEPSKLDYRMAIKSQFDPYRDQLPATQKQAFQGQLHLTFLTLKNRYPSTIYTMRDIEDTCQRCLIYAADMAENGPVTDQHLNQALKHAVSDILLTKIHYADNAMYQRFHGIVPYVPKGFDALFAKLLAAENLIDIPLSRDIALSIYKSLLVIQSKNSGLLNNPISKYTGKPGLVLEGPPGIGKTVLTRLMCQQLGIPFSEITAGYGKQFTQLQEAYNAAKKMGGVILINEFSTIEAGDFDGLCLDAITDGVTLFCTANPHAVFSKREASSKAQEARALTYKLPQIKPDELYEIALKTLGDGQENLANNMVAWQQKIVAQTPPNKQPGLREFLTMLRFYQKEHKLHRAVSEAYQSQLQSMGAIKFDFSDQFIPSPKDAIPAEALCLRLLEIMNQESRNPKPNKTLYAILDKLTAFIPAEKLTEEDIVMGFSSPGISIADLLAQYVYTKGLRPLIAEQAIRYLSEESKKRSLSMPEVDALIEKIVRRTKTAIIRTPEKRTPEASASLNQPREAGGMGSGVSNPSIRMDTTSLATSTLPIVVSYGLETGSMRGLSVPEGVEVSYEKTTITMPPNELEKALLVPTSAKVNRFEWKTPGLIGPPYIDSDSGKKGLAWVPVRLAPHEDPYVYTAEFPTITRISKEAYDSALKAQEKVAFVEPSKELFAMVKQRYGIDLEFVVNECRRLPFEEGYVKLFKALCSCIPSVTTISTETHVEVAAKWDKLQKDKTPRTVLEKCLLAGAGVCVEYTLAMEEFVRFIWPDIVCFRELTHEPKQIPVGYQYTPSSLHLKLRCFTPDGKGYNCDPNYFMPSEEEMMLISFRSMIKSEASPTQVMPDKEVIEEKTKQVEEQRKKQASQQSPAEAETSDVHTDEQVIAIEKFFDESCANQKTSDAPYSRQDILTNIMNQLGRGVSVLSMQYKRSKTPFRSSIYHKLKSLMLSDEAPEATYENLSFLSDVFLSCLTSDTTSFKTNRVETGKINSKYRLIASRAWVSIKQKEMPLYIKCLTVGYATPDLTLKALEELLLAVFGKDCFKNYPNSFMGFLDKFDKRQEGAPIVPGVIMLFKSLKSVTLNQREESLNPANEMPRLIGMASRRMHTKRFMPDGYKTIGEFISLQCRNPDGAEVTLPEDPDAEPENFYVTTLSTEMPSDYERTETEFVQSSPSKPLTYDYLARHQGEFVRPDLELLCRENESFQLALKKVIQNKYPPDLGLPILMKALFPKNRPSYFNNRYEFSHWLRIEKNLSRQSLVMALHKSKDRYWIPPGASALAAAQLVMTVWPESVAVVNYGQFIKEENCLEYGDSLHTKLSIYNPDSTCITYTEFFLQSSESTIAWQDCAKPAPALVQVFPKLALYAPTTDMDTKPGGTHTDLTRLIAGLPPETEPSRDLEPCGYSTKWVVPITTKLPETQIQLLNQLGIQICFHYNHALYDFYQRNLLKTIEQGKETPPLTEIEQKELVQIYPEAVFMSPEEIAGYVQHYLAQYKKGGLPVELREICELDRLSKAVLVEQDLSDMPPLID